MHEHINNRGASGKIRTAWRARKAEVSGNESESSHFTWIRDAEPHERETTPCRATAAWC